MVYKFKPILKTLVWGTENWVLSGVPGNESVVAEGPDAGKTLSEVYGGPFPLLAKFIDAHDDLSIQVHPNDALAMQRHGKRGKTEMWYVIRSEQGHLLSGFSREVSREEYVRRVADGTIPEVLSRYDIAEGDVFFLPAGRIHAIGGGSYLAEIQQASDVTYRIYDYGRLGLDGKPRQLHTAEALDAIDWHVEKDYRTRYEHFDNAETPLVDCPCFTTSLFDLTAPVEKDLRAIDSFYMVLCMEGAATVNGTPMESGEAILLTRDENVAHFMPSGHAKLLTSYCAAD